MKVSISIRLKKGVVNTMCKNITYNALIRIRTSQTSCYNNACVHPRNRIQSTTCRGGRLVPGTCPSLQQRMEALQANISGTCSSAFSGASGALFMRAVTSMVAAHCAIFDDYQWPEDRALEVISKAPEGVSYDFVVVGAGTAGSLLAGQLASLYPDLTVLLVEAGDDPGVDSEIPALLYLGHNSGVDWQYRTKPDGRSCLGFNNEQCIWSKGRAVSGSNSINAMIYIRGHWKDYDSWKVLGNEGWGHMDLIKYFDQIENDLNLSNYKYNENPWYAIMEGAWKELGFSPHKHSEYALVGTQITKILTHNGKRLNTAKTYLSVAPNFHVMKNTVVEKLITDANREVTTGIEIRHKSDIVMVINCTKELILSAGSVGTPQILMLSGIGPKQHLEEIKIKPILDLPVGRNLQDHLVLPIYLKVNRNTPLSPDVTTMMLVQYMLNRTGPLSNIGLTDFMAFIDTKEKDYPDIQFHHTYVPQNNFLIRSYLEGLGYKEEIISEVEQLNKKSDLLGIWPTLLHPKSKGEIILADNNPQSKPVVKANYFDNPDDINTFIKSIEFMKKLQGTAVFKAFGIKIAKLNISGCLLNSDDYWKCYARNMATTIYHPVGTAKMGPRSDVSAVVDQDLLVHGVRNLRVVDASVMPSITGGNTMAPTLAIAKKAIDIIKKYYLLKDEL